MLINNLRAAGSFRDNLRLYDGYDSSRDLIELYSGEGKQGEDYYFKINLANLKFGAEKNLDLYLLINLDNQKEGNFSLPDNIAGETKFPWQLSLCIYDSKNSAIKDSSNNACQGALKNLKFNYAGKYVEFFLDKEILRKIGWKDRQALNLQVFSVKDKQNKIIDSLPSALRGQTTSLPQSISTDYHAGLDSLPHFWEDEVIYFAFTDRFSNGDKSNDGADTNLQEPRAFHGGDWQGIIDKLDYIKDLGATCIWISPVIMNEPKGYHAYWPYDFMKSEPHFGTLTKLKELVEKAHAKGLKIVMDLVLNHTGYTHPWTKDQNYYDWFHHKGDMWLPIPYQMENYSFAGLPDLAQENPKVYQYLLNMAKDWIKESNCDGVRLDAAQNIPHWFWKKFTQEIRDFASPNFLILGEAFNPFPNWVGSYQKDGLDSMFDVPMAWAMRDVFAYNKKKGFIKRLKEAKDFFGNNPCDAIRKVLTLNSGNMYELKLFFSQDSAYDNSNLMVNFIDNPFFHFYYAWISSFLLRHRSRNDRGGLE
ncbi:MAG: hypothetical protein HYU63_09270 [Armatimonadetes bacterium]|nr:hypothetical protein [Armatimonadota bacterium]